MDGGPRREGIFLRLKDGKGRVSAWVEIRAGLDIDIRGCFTAGDDNQGQKKGGENVFHD